jgi:tetratricopeptide (TPR) repeat protein
MNAVIIILGVLVLIVVAATGNWNALVPLGLVWGVLVWIVRSRRSPSGVRTGFTPPSVLKDSKERLAADIQQQRAAGVPLAEIAGDLEQHIEGLNQPTEEWLSQAAHSDRHLKAALVGVDWQIHLGQQRDGLWQIMVERNLQGKDMEKAGRIEEAIALYEANVRDRFDGTHPYDRLRILYTREKQYDDAIRVCEAYVALPDRPNGQNKAHFREWIDKLQVKQGREA